MHPQDDCLFDWIRDGRRGFLSSSDPRWTGNLVSHLMPDAFHGYVKVLHSIEAYYDWIDNPLTPAEISLLGIPACNELIAGGGSTR